MLSARREQIVECSRYSLISSSLSTRETGESSFTAAVLILIAVNDATKWQVEVSVGVL